MRIPLVKYVLNFFSNLKLIHKLLLSYLILIVIPLALLSGLLYSSVSKIIENRVIYSVNQAFDQANSFLSYKLYNIAGKANVLLINKQFIDIMNHDSSSDLYEQVKSMNDLSLFLNSLEDVTNISRARLYVSDDLIYSKNGINIFGLKRIENAKWYNELKKSGKSSLWSPSSYLEEDNEDILSLTKLIKHPNDYSKNIGAIRFDFSKISIINILNKANAINRSLTYVQCPNGDILAASDKQFLNQYITGLPVLEELPGSSGYQSYTTLNHEKVLILYHRIESTDLSMVTIIPFVELTMETMKIRNFILILLITISVVFYLFAYLISYSITKRIKLLANKMRDMHNGKLTVVDIPHGKDEIGGLIEDYNYMAERMTYLIEEQYKSGQKLKSTELKVLQAQINPHFLYNTLDMINWYALKNSGSEIVTIVDSLAKFYRLSLSKGNEVVTLSDELNHVRSYFQIQNFRFKGIKLNVSVPEALEDYTILKLILQPIVENAILHGILCKKSKSGTVTITCRLDNDILILKVEDDGIGIPADKMGNLILGRIENKKGSGFGVKNTNERIQLYYGIDYGVFFSSIYEKGTSVEIRIPAGKNHPLQSP